jgi:hypothetical protein
MQDKKDALAVIAYHNDTLDVGKVYDTRFQYYGIGVSTPRVIFDGTVERVGGMQYGSMYSQYVAPYEQAVAVPLGVELSLSLVADNEVQIDISNISAKQLSGKLHIALVERYRPYQWMDMETVDFVCRAMLPNAEGKDFTIDQGATITSVQKFSVQPDWNYCWIVAFFQAPDKRILQGAMIPIENTIPKIQLLGGPETGAMWLQNSTHLISWSSNRPLGSIEVDFSNDGGKSWIPIGASTSENDQFNWTVPQISSSQCLLAVSDLYGGAKTVSGMFTIGNKGDFNLDGVVNSADRQLLIEFLLENRTGLPGADLNEDGRIDILDLSYFDIKLLRQ